MAQKVIVINYCDVHPDQEATHTDVPIQTEDGKKVEIDMCDRDWNAYAKATTKLAEYGRLIKPERRPRNTIAAAPAPSTGRSRDDLEQIRAWARDNGHPVADRGRLSKSVLDAYDAEH